MMRTVRELTGLVVALVAGFVLLSVLAGPPGVGDIAVSVRSIREGAGAGRLPAEALPGLIAPALWLLWAYLALSTALKALTSFLVGLTQGTLAGARATGRAILYLDRLAERVSVPLVRNSTRMLVTAGVLVKLATSTPAAVAADPHAAIVSVLHDPRPAGHQAEEAEQEPSHTEVRRGEGLYQVAERVWGDGERWPELWEANKGRMMPGGVRFNGSLREGWVLEVPGGKLPVQGRESAPPRWYTVQARDAQTGLRGIAERYLGDEMRWREIYELNRDVIGENPDIIHAGQKLELPAHDEETRANRAAKASTGRQGRPEVGGPHALRQRTGKDQESTPQGQRQPERSESASAGASAGASTPSRPTGQPSPTPTAGAGAVSPAPTQPSPQVDLPAPRGEATVEVQATAPGSAPVEPELTGTSAPQPHESEEPAVPPPLLALAAAGLVAAGAAGALGRRYRRSTRERPLPRERRLSPPEEGRA